MDWSRQSAHFTCEGCGPPGEEEFGYPVRLEPMLRTDLPNHGGDTLEAWKARLRDEPWIRGDHLDALDEAYEVAIGRLTAHEDVRDPDAA